MLDFFTWWYGDNFKRTQKIARYYLIKTWDNFSVGLLLKSIFAPWKQDTTSTRGQSINIVLKIYVMNVFSRLIGFVVRTVVILVGLLFCLAILVFIGIGFIIFLIAPVVPFALFIYGLILLI